LAIGNWGQINHLSYNQLPFLGSVSMKRQVWIRNVTWIVLTSLLIFVSAKTGFTQPANWSVISSGGSPENNADYKQGELIVRFVGGLSQALPESNTDFLEQQISGPRTTSAIKNAIASSTVSGAYVVKEYDSLVPGLALVKLPKNVSVADAVMRFNQSPQILYAQPNYKIRAMVVPNDPRFFEQWALDNTGQTGGRGDADIDAPEAWDIANGTADMIVAVMDSGIDYTHPDLADNMWINDGEVNEPGVVDEDIDYNDVDDDGNGYNDDIWGYDFVDDDFDPMDEHYHGTHVAGIIGAIGNNTVGIAGVCWSVKMMALRILDPNGEGVTSDAIEAMNYAVAWNVNVINASWGGYQYDQGLYDAIAAARDAGILVVAAAGNDGINMAAYPARFDLDNIISVMATDHFDNMAFFSNYSIEDVDLGAPGVGILSTTPTEDMQTGWMDEYGIDIEYAYDSGTSAAAPHVTGACVLIKVVNPNLTYQQVKKIMLRSVDPTLPGLCVSGGRLDLFMALKMARQGEVLNTRTAIKYPTIQRAIDNASDGDTLVAASDFWYIETINFRGKAITVRSGSTAGGRNVGDPTPQNTFISALFDGGSVVTFNNGEDIDSILLGFSVVDGAEGIYVDGSSPQINDCNVTKNTARGLYCSNAAPELLDCVITKNTTIQNGGGIYCKDGSNPSISSCKIIANTASGGGGGIYCESGSNPNVTDSDISSNAAESNGGGIYCSDNCDPNFIRCTISSNTAQWPGGGVYTVNCAPLISGCTITKNRTAWDGGGLYCDTGSLPAVMNSTINGNIADYDGGGIYLNATSIPIKNCLIINNTVDSWDGGGIFCADASPTITNCTFIGNSSNEFDGVGGAVYCAGTSAPQVANCIFNDNRDIAIYEQDADSEPIMSSCLFNDNLQGDYYDRDSDRAYSFLDVEPDSILSGSNNIIGDPMFVRGRLGNYYLSQYEAGQILDVDGQFVDPNVNPQDATSPAVDAGSDDAVALGMHIYSTRTDNYEDADGNKDLGRVDIGYHYNDTQPAMQYSLTTMVTPAGVGNISPDPAGSPHIYIQYSQVPLIVSPEDPNVYQFKSWQGTDDDMRMDRTSTGQIAAVQKNIVTMDLDKIITVRFETILVTLRTRVIDGRGTVTPRTGRYTRDTVVDLTAAPINPSHFIKWDGTNNDYSYQRENTVTMSGPFVIDPQGREFKEVEVIFYAPRTLDVPGDYTNIQVAINEADNGDIVRIAPGIYDIRESSLPYEWEKIIISGKAITLTSNNPDDPCTVAATVIYNCGFEIWNVSRNTVINGLTIQSARYDLNTIWITPTGSGRDGPGGRIGDTYGGGMELMGDASPDVRNCIFIDCAVGGVHGGHGNGGGDVDGSGWGGNGGWPGAAYGGAVSVGFNGNPIFTNCSFIGCLARGGDGGNGANGGTDHNPGHGGGWGDPFAPWWEDGPFEDYWRYTGFGGAAYCDSYSTPDFVDCRFINNLAQGGSCGLSGTPIVTEWPYRHYRIDAFGGAVYCEADSSPAFTGCTFINNEADVNGINWHGGMDDTDAAVIKDDPYISYGGAIAFEDGANPAFENCTFNDNIATIGGGMWATWANPDINDCDFEANTAYHGGGVYFVGNSCKITKSNFYENQALYNTSLVDPNNVIDVLGEGAAIHCFDANTTIVDCNIFNNHAAASGGGIYLSGSESAWLKNCLISKNFAGRDGGGISANWHSDCNVVNCTIADNRVGGSGFGGGLYCSYYSYANIVNSIVWDNLGDIGSHGSQIAVATDYEYDPRLSTVNVSYSDVQDATDPNAYGAKTEALDLIFCIDTTGSMWDDIDAVKNAAMQITNSIATKIPDYRIAVVEYKDFNQPNVDTAIDDRYGAINDYPYRTVAGFTTDTDAVIDAFNSLTASGGADWPESVYTALMHCIDHNSLVETLAGNFYGADPGSTGPGAWRSGNVVRVILLMADAPPHDPEPFTDYTLNDVLAAAGGWEQKHIVSLLVGGDLEAATYFTDLAEGTGGTLLTATGAGEVVSALMKAIDLISVIPSPIFVGTNCVLNQDRTSYNWAANSHNIDEDPLFVAGYFLSQVAAGQSMNSPCVDAGSDLLSILSLDKYTTRTDSVPDSDIIDMGYHYDLFGIPQFQLSFSAITSSPDSPVPVIIEPSVNDPSYDGLYNWHTTVTLRIDTNYDSNYYQVLWNGTDDDSLTGPTNTVTLDSDKVVTVGFVKTAYDLAIEVINGSGRGILRAEWIEDDDSFVINAAQTHAVRFGTVVQLIAEPDEGYRVRRWEGTDNDRSRSVTNTVTMNANKTIRVEFGPPVTITVPKDYPTIRNAIAAAQVGDTIVIRTGTYFGPAVAIDKPVTIRSEHPDDPCCIAETIIDRTGYADRAFDIVTGADGTVLNGLTIQNCNWAGDNGNNGSRQDPCHPDGYDGDGVEGAALYISEGIGPITIKNCIFRDNQIRGGSGGIGIDSDAVNNAGRGGWAGWARGGAIYCGPNSESKFINCQIINNGAYGGNGGDGGAGGNYQLNVGTANYGGNWSTAGEYHYDPFSLTRVFISGDLWQHWGYIGNYRWYSAYGGGVYCDVGSKVDFEDCTIGNNFTLGGMSGEGGDRPGQNPEPIISYEIPSYGGGIYCAADAMVMFNDCAIGNNVSSSPEAVDPAAVGPRYRIDPYIGYGGGVCAEDSAIIAFTNSTFIENEASLGGGAYWVSANPVLADSNFVDNTAYRGGGVYVSGNVGEIVRSDFSRNYANGFSGKGGAIYCFDASAVIADCNISYNEADSSGGGIYISGSNTVSVENCFLTNNLAGRDGGGISVSWYAESLISNCTFVSNSAPGTFGEAGKTGFGGGLYCSYESDTEVINSIFWDNFAIEGFEIAVGTGFEHAPSPARLAVSYSDVRGGRSAVRVAQGCTLYWLDGNIDLRPLFVSGPFGSYYLSQIDAGQLQNSLCIDAGSDLASKLSLVGYTTRTDEEPDKGIVDMGYHYPLGIEACSFCDLNFDGQITFSDFAVFMSRWLDGGCSNINEWCGGADFTFDRKVGFEDLSFMSKCWLVKDTDPPTPNPSQWEQEPNAISLTSIGMTAKSAVDAWGWDVQYYFERVPDGQPSSGWQKSPTWQDTGLTTDFTYGYRVKASDQLGNETDWSEVRYARSKLDITPPSIPNWQMEPNVISISEISMEAAPVFDDSDVEYYFGALTVGGHDSGWQDDPNYTDIGLTSDTEYCYRVKARDKSPNQNESGWSSRACATTLPPIETMPPTPDPMQFDENGLPTEIDSGGGFDQYYVTMTAVEATDESGGVEYYFLCLEPAELSGVSPNGLSSGWITEPTWTVRVGRQNQLLRFQVKARDIYGNETQLSEPQAMILTTR